MFTAGVLSWLLHEQGLMTLLAENWFLGMMLVTLIVFLETGLVVLPFLPGDSLLFATGAVLGVIGVEPWLPMLMLCVAAIVGDSVNYSLGKSFLGGQLIRRGWVKPHHLEKTKAYFDRFGGPTVLVGRFIPIVRTVAPFLAGMSGMNARQFLFFNILGGVIWCACLTLSGYWLGQVPWVRENLAWLAGLVVLISFLPVIYHALKAKRERKMARQP